MRLSGVYTAIVTPFKEGQLDLEALERLIESQIAGGVAGIVPCGTTGESPTLSLDEKLTLISECVRIADKKIAVIAGTGSNSTEASIALSVAAQERGVDGLMLVAPYYNKPTQAGLAAHFRAVAAAIDRPIMIYNIPGRSGVEISVATFESLADEKKFVAIKDATGNVMHAQALLSRLGDRFAIMSGDDALTVPFLSIGGRGVVSVISNLWPQAASDVVKTWENGDASGARALHAKLFAAGQACFYETNPGPVKWALAELGVMEKEMRLPLVFPGEAAQAVIRQGLGQFDERFRA